MANASPCVTCYPGGEEEEEEDEEGGLTVPSDLGRRGKPAWGRV